MQVAGPSNDPDLEQGGSDYKYLHPELARNVEERKNESDNEEDTDEEYNFDEGETNTRKRLNTEIPRGALS